MSQILLPSVYDGLYLSDFFEPCFRCCSRLWSWCCGTKEYSSRTVWIGKEHVQKFPANVIRNQKYNTFTFIPVVSKLPKSLSKNTSISRKYFVLFSGSVQPIQILSQLFLSGHGHVTIRSRIKNWLPLHLLGSPRICNIRVYDS